VLRLFALPFSFVIACGSHAAAPAAQSEREIVAQALQKCTKVSTKSSVAPSNAKQVEIFDACIVNEANRSALRTRKQICALGKSGGIYRSTVEIYMKGDKCVTDYE
jgi:hypothetical protein